MSETGQGLLDDGQELDMIPGSNIKNAWGTSICHIFLLALLIHLRIDAIVKVFPLVHVNA